MFTVFYTFSASEQAGHSDHSISGEPFTVGQQVQVEYRLQDPKLSHIAGTRYSPSKDNSSFFLYVALLFPAIVATEVLVLLVLAIRAGS